MPRLGFLWTFFNFFIFFNHFAKYLQFQNFRQPFSGPRRFQTVAHGGSAVVVGYGGCGAPNGDETALQPPWATAVSFLS
jgi:hypothetical protein